MPRTVTVGLDGSPESRAAAEWAAREAKLLGLPVRLVHVWEPAPEPPAQAPLPGAETYRRWTERVPREAAEGLRLRHPGVEVRTEHLPGRPAEILTDEAADAELLVLGSRALGGVGGFLAGPVGLSVVAHAERPVVLVRAGEQATDEHERDPAGIPSAAAAFRPVVLGLDTAHPDEDLIRFAFEAVHDTQDVGQELKRYGGAHAAIALAVNEAAFEAVASGLRRGGKLVMVALPAQGTVRVPIFDTVLGGTSVIGSIVGTRQDLAEVFQLHAEGRTRVIRESRPLSSVNESIDEVLRGQVKARIVFDLAEGG
ncbi:universal stress protein [Streptomyces sp. NPDC001312]|uniref:universal stress protein n=1 Tax=Streptomyces sp. NPDC001312 TaxID=3364561 RepID=UPI003682A29B